MGGFSPMLCILGLDGATLDLAGPWMDAGKLPTLAQLRRGAVWGVLESTIPPATLPSWTTFMTGVNPGRHGIYDFTRREFPDYRVSFVNGTFRKAPSVWRILSGAGKRVGVFGLPGTYPPEPVNGCMVSGFDTPVTARANRSFVYPSELAGEVIRLGGFTFADFQEYDWGEDWCGQALAKLLRSIESKEKLVRELAKRDRWDCLFLLFGETDTVAHHFWHFADARSPRFDPHGAERFGDAILRVYQAVDAAIGRILEMAGADPKVLVVSDHGFGGAGTKVVHINRWLESQGWLRFRGTGACSPAATGKRILLRAVPHRAQAALFRACAGVLAGRMESRARFAGIDWKRTRAFSEELNYFPSIWINRVGRDRSGTVGPLECERVCDEITAALREWRDPDGARVVRGVWRREEIYSGPWVDFAPDLLLELEEPGGYSYSCLPSNGASGPPVLSLARQAWRGGKRFGTSGSHRREGMFLLYPAPQGLAGMQRRTMLDMAPTVLALCDLPQPGWMEGTPLVPNPIDSYEKPQRPAPEAPYTPAETASIEEKLRSLGYLG